VLAHKVTNFGLHINTPNVLGHLVEKTPQSKTEKKRAAAAAASKSNALSSWSFCFGFE
jgi:hypothetical protein